MYAALRAQECVLVVTVSNAMKVDVGSETHNSDCMLQELEQSASVSAGSGAFALKADHSHYCTTFLRDVIDVNMYELMDQHIVQDAIEDVYAELEEVRCAADGEADAEAEEADNAVSMNMHDLGGVFICHMIVTFFLVVWAVNEQGWVAASAPRAGTKAHARLARQFTATFAQRVVSLLAVGRPFELPLPALDSHPLSHPIREQGSPDKLSAAINGGDAQPRL